MHKDILMASLLVAFPPLVTLVLESLAFAGAEETEDVCLLRD